MTTIAKEISMRDENSSNSQIKPRYDHHDAERVDQWKSKQSRFTQGIAFSSKISVPRNPPTIIAPWCTASGPTDTDQPILDNPAISPIIRFPNANNMNGNLEYCINIFAAN